VLHQPSYPLYQMFSSVLLLGKGGKTVYLGPGEHAMTYFNQCGYEMPPLLNPADFYMDVIAGKYGLPPALKLESKKASAKQAEFFNSEGKPGILFDMWDENRGKYEELAMKTFVHAEPILMENVEALEPMGSTNILKSMGKYMQRAAIQHARASDLFIFDMILVMGCGLFLGFSYGVWTLPKLAQNHLFYSLGLALTVGLASLRPFGAERIVFWREVSPGAGMNLNPLPYFLAKNLVEIPRLIVLTMLFASCFFPQVKPLCNYFEFCGKSIMMSWYVGSRS
jgi:hypothetical protein